MQTTDQAYFNASRGEMLAFVPQHAMRVLDVGCGAGGFGALVRERREGCEVFGVEMNQSAAQDASTRLNQVINGTIEEAFSRLNKASFDCIAFNDLLEHLVDPWETLRRAQELLKPDGVVIASIPNVRYFPVVKGYIFEKDWKYDKWGVLDRTHLRFFTQGSARRLFAESGYRVKQEAALFPTKLPWRARLLNRISGGALNDMRFERFAFVAEMATRNVELKARSTSVS